LRNALPANHVFESLHDRAVAEEIFQLTKLARDRILLRRRFGLCWIWPCDRV
jgi:hypothetical protein